MNINDNDTDLCEINLPSSKRGQNKKTCASKHLFHKNVENSPDDEPIFKTLIPVSLDQYKNINNQENTPPSLIIDSSKEACASQTVLSDYFPPSEPVGERVPRATSNSIHTTESYISKNSSRYTSVENRSGDIDRSSKERPTEQSLTPIVNRSTKSPYATNIRSQPSTSRIIVSVDRSERDSNENFNINYRTSTPMRSSRREQTSISLTDSYNDSFSVDSIPKETYDILTRFSEFRRLVKAFNNERKKCEIWSKDFARLKMNYEQLQEQSFPRPPAPALSYLVDMVTLIQQSGGRADPRSDDQLARDLGENPVFLMGLKDVTPQQTALNVFNHLYPGYEAKVELGSVKNLDIKRPGLLQTLLTFAQRASPGSTYKMQELRDGLSNSIRGARHHWRKLTGSMNQATALLGRNNGNQMELRDENHINPVNEIPTDLMFHSRRNIDTVRRSSQRRNNQRLARIQRQIVLETVASNMSSLVYQHCEQIPTQPFLESVQVVAQNNDKVIDNLSLSMSSGSLNISDEHIHVSQSKSNIEININQEDPLNENQPITNSNNAKQVEDGEEIIQDLISNDNVDEDNEKEKFIIKSDDEDSSVDADDDDLFNGSENRTDRDFTSTEIASALSLLKSRHSLTNTCISNICKLLKLLRVPNCPSDFRQVRSLICKPYQSTISEEILVLCPSCHKVSSNSVYCTSSPTCINRDKFIMNPTINHTLHMEPQIRSVLERNNLIKPKDNETVITDIVDSSFYRKLLSTEPNPFITLLINSDGAVVKSISRSIWITTFVINELSPSVRFNRENVQVGDGYARVFVYENNNDAEPRSNASYDEAIRILKKPLGRRRRASINSINNDLDGLKGSCVLRALKHFDVYQSFTSDTLHTFRAIELLYIKARMLRIFFGNVSKKSGITQAMSVKKSLGAISSAFKSMFYPSSTFRIPRDIKLHAIYKANELKIFLLFGYSTLEHILTRERYDHFRYLAFAAHLIASAKHDQSTYFEVLDLLQEFDKRFETALTRTVHNGNRPTIELLKNIDLLQQTWLATKDSSFPPEMRLFDHQIHSNMRYSIPRQISDLNHHNRHQIRAYKKVPITSLETDVSDFVIKYAGDRSYVLYKTVVVHDQRYSADSINIHRSTHDGCIVYDKNDTPTIGFLETTIHLIDNNEFSLIMRPVILYSTADTLSINDRVYKCTNVLYGTPHGSSIEAVHYKFLIQKLAFRYGTDLNFPPIVKSMFFFQFPNLRSST
ncbi:unnamed protein product [Rotaria sp. Silwood2]|nr:unnamed protein product [Rotaria sp. Silwood2]